MPVQDVLYEFVDQFSFVRAQLVLLLEVKKIKLTHNEIDALTWITLEGWNPETHLKIAQANILVESSINNLGTKLNKLGLLVNIRKGERALAPFVRVLKDDDGLVRAGIGTSMFIKRLNGGSNKT